MSDSAVWLTEHVLPRVPIRQWVCTLPHGLRALAGYDRERCALVVDTFVRELMRSHRYRAKHLFGLRSVEEAFAGAVTVIQRFDSALRLNVHMHTLVLDGVYVCRYLTRPPIATERLTEAGDELRYELKMVWRDGTRCVMLDPYELLARMCAMVPPPWFHMTRFHGVFAPNAKLRAQVVASAGPCVQPNEPAAPNPVQLPLFGKLVEEPEAEAKPTRRKPWAWLLRHVFAIDVNVCPKCAGRMKWHEVLLTEDAIRAGLARAGLAARGPPKRARVPFGQLSLPFAKMRRV